MRASVYIFRMTALHIFFVMGVALPVSVCQKAIPAGPIPSKQFLKSSLLDRSGTRLHASPDLFYSLARDPYFCRKERDMEKHNGFPIRLRLGEWNWVEQYEGKRPKTEVN